MKVLNLENGLKALMVTLVIFGSQLARAEDACVNLDKPLSCECTSTKMKYTNGSKTYYELEVAAWSLYQNRPVLRTSTTNFKSPQSCQQALGALKASGYCPVNR